MEKKKEELCTEEAKRDSEIKPLKVVKINERKKKKTQNFYDVKVSGGIGRRCNEK